MRVSAKVVVAVVASVVPLAWLGGFAVLYRCDLAHYGRAWRAGAPVEWATLWVLLVTAGCTVIGALVLPKALRYAARGKPLTRGEWIALALVVPLVVLAAGAAPASMVDLTSRLAALAGQPVDQCRH